MARSPPKKPHPKAPAHPAALLEVYLAKRPDLVRFFTARTGSGAEAEDIVQALYFKVVQVKDAEVLYGVAYLYRLGMNLMIDQYRSSRRSRVRDRAYHHFQQGGAEHADVSNTPSPEDEAGARLRLERLLIAVRDLPPQCRRVFQMHKLDGLSHGEVAEALGISRSAVEKHMINALRRLDSARRDS